MGKTVSPAQQERSRLGWQRALDAATELFLAGGYEALSITEVCRRAGISAPSLYARVDGLHGLFLAVFERCMVEVHESERRAFAEVDGSIESVVDAVSGVFIEHSDALRAIIRRSTADPELLAEGAQESRRVKDWIAELLPGDGASTQLAARLIYTECAFRIIYGERFWNQQGESVAEFRDSLTEMVRRVLAAGE